MNLLSNRRSLSRTIVGRFELDALVGHGGMGSVWRARDRETGTTVAVKLMHGDHGDRFMREAELLRAARQSTALMHDQMRRAWEDFVVAECTARPVVLVFEDLQWGDAATIKFVSAALRRAAELPFLVIAAARPEIVHLFPNLFVGKQSTHVQLGDLTARAAEKLIRAVLGAVEPRLVKQLVERAGGNAFYLEELIRAVAEGKGNVLPETVLAMLQARIDALDARTRRVLRAASVFGQVFWVDGVELLLGNQARDGLALEELVERELVEPHGEGRFPGQLEYAFRHAIVRDAAYSLLTDQDRTLGHRLAGGWLEAHGEHDAIALADHFAAGEDRGRAARWYGRAADEALGANELDAAIALAERGIACGADGVLRGQLREIELEAQLWRGDVSGAVAHGEEALQLLPPGSARWYETVGLMARLYASLGRPGDVIVLGRTLLERGLDHSDEHAVLAWVKVALRLLFLCEYAVADCLLAPLDAVKRSLSTSENVRGAVLELFAHRCQVDGDLDAALLLTTAAVEAYRAAGNLRDAYYEQIGVAVVQNELGGYPAAEATLREVVIAADARGIATVSTVCKLNLGLTLCVLGNLEEAEAVERAALDELVASGDLRLAMNAYYLLTRILCAAGKLDDAIALGLAGEASGSTVAIDPCSWSLLSAALGQALLACGRTDEALPRACRAARILEQLGHLDEGEAFVQLVHVDALFAAGDHDAAHEALRVAYEHLQRRAARLADPKWRTSFLHDVPDNARVVTLARAHGIAS